MAEGQRVRTRILIISDTHGVLPADVDSQLSFRKPLPSADIAIHCGDLTMTGKLDEHQRTINLLKSLQAELKIVIPGNHDLTLDSEYCRAHPRLYGWNRNHTLDDIEASKLMYVDSSARQANIHYLVEGTRTFTLKNGASCTIYASAYTPEFYDWGFPYERSEDRFNPPDSGNPIPDFDAKQKMKNVDIVITHGPPKGVLDTTTRGIAAGCEHLRQAIKRCKPLLHCFGHIHEGWGAVHKQWSDDSEDWESCASNLVKVDKEQMINEMAAFVDATLIQHGEDTLFVNASIMSVGYEPSQGPWLVDLMLPRVINFNQK